MTNNKLPQTIFNAVSDNVERLAQLFPAAVKDGEVDFAALKEELGQFAEVGAEKYELTWAGKQAAKKLSQEDARGRTLKFVPGDSKNADTTENLYIEGDNLEVLKLLRQNYYGAIKMIYIDPPYNTGNDFVYRDNFAQSQAQSDEDEGETVDGERMIVNQKSSNRYHANWLNMMYPRLKVAKDLLREDGVIFISIDDNEVGNLCKICDEIFGQENLVAQISWKRKKEVSSDSKNVSTQGEYIICYAKSSLGELAFEPVSQEYINKSYNEPTQEFPLGKWRPVPITVSKGLSGGGYEYSITTPSGAVHNRLWAYPEKSYQELVHNNRVYFGKSNDGIPQRVMYAHESKGQPVTNYWDDVATNKEGKKEILSLFEDNAFDTPKPTSLLLKMLRVTTTDADTILDFFSGSATTAHAVMQLNAQDGGNRRFIMVQVPEACSPESEAAKMGYSNICEIGKERIRRAGDKIKAEIESEQPRLGEEPRKVPDIGFKVFKVADTNIRWTHMALTNQQIEIEYDENGKPISDKDRLDFMSHFTDIDVVYEVLLRQRDIPLSAKVERLPAIGERTYIFADSYAVCLEEMVTGEMVEKLAAIEPTPIKYVFRDSAFEDNISFKDETIRRLEAYIARNTGEQKRAYTVEFI